MFDELKRAFHKVKLIGSLLIIYILIIVFLTLTFVVRDSFSSSQLDQGRIPANCERWKRDTIRIAQHEMGLNAPSSLIGSIILKESSCNENAHNARFGATGLGQFIPNTVTHVRQLSRELRNFNPRDGRQSIQAIIVYLEWSKNTVASRRPVNTQCDRVAFGLSAYNGGAGWVNRDRTICNSVAGCDPGAWFSNTEQHSRRNRGAFRENRDYVSTIINQFTPLFINSGWGGPPICR